MKHLHRHLWGLLIALVALGLSASLAFGARPPQANWAGAGVGSHVPLAGQDADEVEDGDEDATEAEDEDTDETEETEETEEEDAEDAGENCTTDPSLLTPEELEGMKHGSIVCWAAHQTEWPEWFANHGAFVRCWAHQGKADAPSCTEAPVETDAAATGHGNGKSKGSERGQAKGKHKSD